MEIRLEDNQSEVIAGLTVEYPYVLHRVRLSETRVPWHWHEEVEFVLVKEGRMRLNTAGKSWIFSKGEGFYTNSNVLSSVEQVEGEDCRFDSHLLHSAFLGGHFKSIFETKYLNPVIKNHDLEILEIRGENERQRKMVSLLEKAARLQDEPDTEFQTRNVFSDIWLLLLEEMRNTEYAKPAVQLSSQERLQTMISFIQHNYDQKISLEEIASSALISEREALRCFQACIQKSPFAYLMEYRIEMSQKLLRDSDLPVGEIAMRTGFSSSAYYGKVFKKQLGMTPGAYRKSNANKTA